MKAAKDMESGVVVDAEGELRMAGVWVMSPINFLSALSWLCCLSDGDLYMSAVTGESSLIAASFELSDAV